MGVSGREAVIVGIGIDVTENARMARLLERSPRAIGRLFSLREQESVGFGAETVNRWAARFAAKEALIKACGGIHGSRWVEIEVIRQPHQKPWIEVQGGLREWLQECNLTVWLSMSHERHLSVAMVVLESREHRDLD